MRHQKSPGFSLIELIVVLTITALAMALLLPVLAAAREKGRQSACLSNLHQIGLACGQYAASYDECDVPEQAGYQGNTTLYWPSLLVPFVGKNGGGKWGVFYCPSSGDVDNGWFAPDPRLINTTIGQGKTTYCGVVSGDASATTFTDKPHRLSYSRNLLPSSGWHTPGWNGLGRFGFAPPSGLSVTEAQVEDPAGTIAIFDAMAGAKYAAPQTPANNTCTSGTASMSRLSDEASTDYFPDSQSLKPAYRHSSGFNALFGDGHAHWLAYGSTTPCMWSIQADPYPTDSAAIVSSCKKP